MNGIIPGTNHQQFDYRASIAACRLRPEHIKKAPVEMVKGLNGAFNQLDTKVRGYLLLRDPHIVAVVCGALVAHRFNEDPLWLMLVGAPSNAKTELLEGVAGISTIFRLSDLTPNTFLSGAQKKDDKGDDKDCSLLAHINGRIIMMKDFGTVLSMGRDKRAAILAQLREIYDGSFSKAFGTGSYRNWQGHVGFIGAVTTAIDSHRSVMASLGERFTFYRMTGPDRRAVAGRALSNIRGGKNHNGRRRTEIKKAFGYWNNSLKVPALSAIDLPDKHWESIISLADLAAHVRTSVDRAGEGRKITARPEPEGPPRLAKQFYLLAAGITVARGNHAIGDVEIDILRKVARDTMPTQRTAALDALAALSEDASVTTREVSATLKLPFSTTKEVLEDLNALGLISQHLAAATPDEISGKPGTRPYKWQITSEAKTLLSVCEITT